MVCIVATSVLVCSFEFGLTYALVYAWISFVVFRFLDLNWFWFVYLFACLMLC